jgi:hypothetical protein
VTTSGRRAQSERDRQVAEQAGAELVKSARAENRPGGGPAAHASPRGFWRALGDVLGDMIAELILGLVALAIFSGAATATWFGWQHSPLATVGVYVVLAAFLAYGCSVIWQSRRRRASAVSRTKLASAAAVMVVVALWIGYIAQYHA